MNPVISREYVEKNYIKKTDLKQFIESELFAINKCKSNKTTARQFQLDGMEAVYKAIKNIFLEEIENDNRNTNDTKK